MYQWQMKFIKCNTSSDITHVNTYLICYIKYLTCLLVELMLSYLLSFMSHFFLIWFIEPILILTNPIIRRLLFSRCTIDLSLTYLSSQTTSTPSLRTLNYLRS